LADLDVGPRNHGPAGRFINVGRNTLDRLHDDSQVSADPPRGQPRAIGQQICVDL
jgi:hypothetical protein